MWVRLYDHERVPAHWLEVIRPGEFCVFVQDAATRAPRFFDGRAFGPGGDASVEIVSDFAAAERFAEEIVRRDVSLCCEIYDHTGKSGEALRTVYDPSVRGKYEGRPRARREMWTGVGILAVASCFIAYDMKRDLAWLWGYVVGLKLTLVGGGIFVKGFSRYFERS